MNLNHFVITGNVTRDLELRHTQNGTPAVTYTVAVNNVRYDDGKKYEECDFIPVSTTGKQAERDAKFLHKGSPVAVEGRLRSWWKADEKRGGFNFKAIRVQYLGKPIAVQQGADQVAGGSESEAAEEQFHQEQDEWLRSYDATERSAARHPVAARSKA